MTDKSFLGNNASGNWFYPMALVAAVLLLIFWKEGRKKFVIPAMIIGLVIANPWFRDLWEKKLHLQYYYRVLWIVPVIPLCAAVPAGLAGKIKNGNGKGLAALACAGLFALAGTFVYTGWNCSFEVPAPNADKLPKEIPAVAEYLLSRKEEPRVVADRWASLYLRQYSGKIHMLFGRDVDGYIWDAGTDAMAAHEAIQDPEGDMRVVSDIMLNDGYDYLVIWEYDEQKGEDLRACGFEQEAEVAGYRIYTAHGTPTKRKTRNERGQVISETTLDEAGNPVNGAEGWATVSYAYDDRGRVVREFRTDTEGNGAADANGQAGTERAYDNRDHMTMERFLGTDGKPLNRADKGYAERRMRRDAEGNITEERYYDAAGQPVHCAAGYAAVKRTYEEKRLKAESWYDTDGTAMTLGGGYAGRMWTYDGKGNVTRETYVGRDSRPVNSENGYATEEKEYDAAGNVMARRYLDAEGRKVTACTGWAEAYYTYDKEGRIIREEYFGPDGEPCPQAAGYTAIEQEYNKKGVLVRRRYLGPDGKAMNRTDGYAEAVWIRNAERKRWEVSFLNAEGGSVSAEGLNLVQDVTGDAEGWSAWMRPGEEGSSLRFTLGSANLGDMEAGERYTCQVEVEFRGVTAAEGGSFRFRTVGGADGNRTADGIWDSTVVMLREVPTDGVYQFRSTRKLKEKLAGASSFEIAFRCDDWGGGAFRVRKIKIEKGRKATEWTPGL